MQIDGAPWLPYRFPRGRLRAVKVIKARVPWLPYRFPRGRLGAAQVPGMAVIAACNTRRLSEQNQLLGRFLLTKRGLPEHELHAPISACP